MILSRWGCQLRLCRRSRLELFISLDSQCLCDDDLLSSSQFLLFSSEEKYTFLFSRFFSATLLLTLRFFSGNDVDGIKKYMLPLLSSVSGERMRIRRTTPSELGLLRTWFGLALRTSPAEIGRVISSTYPFKWTIRIKSSAPHGRTQAKQHLKLFPIIVFEVSQYKPPFDLSYEFWCVIYL